MRRVIAYSIVRQPRNAEAIIVRSRSFSFPFFFFFFCCSRVRYYDKQRTEEKENVHGRFQWHNGAVRLLERHGTRLDQAKERTCFANKFSWHLFVLNLNKSLGVCLFRCH